MVRQTQRTSVLYTAAALTPHCPQAADKNNRSLSTEITPSILWSGAKIHYEVNNAHALYLCRRAQPLGLIAGHNDKVHASAYVFVALKLFLHLQ